MNVEIKIITDRLDKLAYKERFQDFFVSVYDQSLSDEKWEHQFLNSPYEDSPLFLAMDADQVVGCALMIPQKVRISGRIFDYYLFTTSAIAQEWRPLGVYANMLIEQRQYAKQKQKSFIFAFPNKMAYPVVKLFGGFKDIYKTALVRCRVKDLMDQPNGTFELDESCFKWRFEHNAYRFFRYRSLVLIGKAFEHSIDILAAYSLGDIIFQNQLIEEINNDTEIVTLQSMIDSSATFEAVDKVNAVYYPIGSDVDLTGFNINLLMSDVF